MNNLTTFYLLRHGITEWNEKRLIQGSMDSPLTANGIKEVENLAKKLKNIKFDYVYSSDLLRARRTAEIIALEHKLSVETDKLIRERSFGNLEGKPSFLIKEWDETLNRLTNAEKDKYRHDKDIETNEEVANRAITFIKELSVRFPSKTILVVSHGGLIRQFLIRIGFATYDNMVHGAVRNGAFVKIQSDGNDLFVKEISGITITS